jgi:hypothetical protein
MTSVFKNQKNIHPLEHDITNVDTNSHVEYFENNFRSTKCYFAKYDNKLYRFKKTKSHNKWLPCCPKDECMNFMDNCVKHKKEIDELIINSAGNPLRPFRSTDVHYLEIDFPEITDLKNVEYFMQTRQKKGKHYAKHNNITYRFSDENMKWQKICCFEDCCNFRKIGDYCEYHECGVVNEKINTYEVLEAFITDLLSQSEELTNVKNIGRDGGKSDIIFQVKDEVENGLNYYRGVQVKTLTKLGGGSKNGYIINDLSKYNQNMLIVGVTTEKDKFIIFYKRDIDKNHICANFVTNVDSNLYLFNNQDTKINGLNFKETLIHMCKSSMIYNETEDLGERQLTEKESLKRFKLKCEENGILCEINPISEDVIDGTTTFNNIKKLFQHKSSNLSRFKNCICRIAHYINSQSISYSQDDGIDFFIIEVISEHNFYIIPINVMAFFGYIKTDKYKGKSDIIIPLEKYCKDHFLSQFKNAFHLLQTSSIYDISLLIDINNPLYLVYIKCAEYDLDLDIDYSVKNTKLFKINNKLVKIINSTKIANKSSGYLITNLNKSFVFCISSKFNNDDIPDFFLLQIKNEDYIYVIPKQCLIDRYMFGHGDYKSVLDLSIPCREFVHSQNKWAFDYIDKFDQFK